MTIYYTLTPDGTLAVLRLPVHVNGRMIIHPTVEQCAALDPPAYPRCDDDMPPTPPDGKVVKPDGWETRDGVWRRVWRIVDAPPPTLADYDAAMEDYLVQERSARGYTTREPDCYLASANPRWAADAREWVAHRDAVMAYALALMNDVQAGRREAPPMAEFRAGLPAITWSYTD